jgi:hypothetical protein
MEYEYCDYAADKICDGLNDLGYPIVRVILPGVEQIHGEHCRKPKWEVEQWRYKVHYCQP